MKTKILMSIALILLVILSMLVFARTERENLDGSVRLEKGWNLVTFYTIKDPFEDDSDFLTKDIRVAFFYNRYNKEYVRLYPNREEGKLKELASQMRDPEKGWSIYEYGGFANSAMWLYSNKDQTLDFRTHEGPVFLEHVGLKAGWNFLAITPEMKGMSFKDFKGDCEIVKYCWWQFQEWTCVNWVDLSQYMSGKIADTDSDVWRGLVIKVSNDCILGSSSTTEPPILPS